MTDSQLFHLVLKLTPRKILVLMTGFGSFKIWEYVQQNRTESGSKSGLFELKIKENNVVEGNSCGIFLKAKSSKPILSSSSFHQTFLVV